MHFIFLVDQYDSWNIDKDTSFALMQGAHRKDHKIFLTFEGGITRKNNETIISVEEVIPQNDRNHPFKFLGKHTLTSKTIDAVFIRTDPPFDQDYLMQTWLLDLLPKHIPILNNPSGIRTVNEKLWATQFTSIIPRTLVSRNKNELIKFIKEEKKAVLKPTDGFGGKGISILTDTESYLSKLESLTEYWKKEVILQQFLPESEIGDKRILLLDGEPLGAVLRVHAKNKFKNNFMAGGKPVQSDITQRDYKIIEILKPHLQKLKLYFVGIDVIGDYLTEVNVTSPTCIKEINHLNNVQLEDKVIEFTENLIEQSKTLDNVNS